MERGNHTFIVKPSDDVTSPSHYFSLSFPSSVPIPVLLPSSHILTIHLIHTSALPLIIFPLFFLRLLHPYSSSFHPSLLSSTLPVIISLFLYHVMSSFHLTLPYKALPHTPMSHTLLPLSALRTPQATHHGTLAADTSASPGTGEGVAGEES